MAWILAPRNIRTPTLRFLWTMAVMAGPRPRAAVSSNGNKESRSVGGKDAQLTTFVDATRSNSGLKYIAALYVVVKPVEPDRLWEWPTTLEMSVTSDRRKDRDVALAIFRTIRFE